MQPYDRPTDEIERLFVEAYERLYRACRLFDQGHQSEAPDIAKEISNFVYDHGNSSTSILTAMKAKHQVNFVDSADGPTPAHGGILLSNEYRLMYATVDFDGMDYKPFLADKAPYPALQFDDWWIAPIFTRYVHTLPDGREKISRSELVMHLRHKEGGAHVAARYFPSDSRADKMRRLMEGEYVDGYMSLDDGPPMTAESHAPAYAAVRQIGYEVLATLEQFRTDLTHKADLRPRVGPRMKLGPR